MFTFNRAVFYTSLNSSVIRTKSVTWDQIIRVLAEKS